MNWLLDKPIAHRGLHCGSVIPENSLLAFQGAIDLQLPIELDVQLLADGNVVVFHDKTLDRMTQASGQISEKTIDDLDNIYLKESTQKIPLLSEVLDLIQGQVPLLIEVKNEGKVGNLEVQLLEQLKTYSGDFAIQSFNPYVLAYYKQHIPHVLRGQLASQFKNIGLSWYNKFLLSHLVYTGISDPHFIAYNIQDLPHCATTIARRFFKKPLIAWTIRSDADKEKAVKYADNIIFDPYSF